MNTRAQGRAWTDLYEYGRKENLNILLQLAARLAWTVHAATVAAQPLVFGTLWRRADEPAALSTIKDDGIAV